MNNPDRAQSDSSRIMVQALFPQPPNIVSPHLLGQGEKIMTEEVLIHLTLIRCHLGGGDQ